MVKECKGIVREKTLLNGDTAHLSITGKEINYLAGQFFMLGTTEEPETKRAYSVASAPWEEEIAFCIRAVENGKVSPQLFKSLPANSIQIKGPYGHCLLTNNFRDIILFAVGTGVAPYRGIIRELFKKHYSGMGENTTRKVHLLFGCKTTKDIFYEEEFTKLAREINNFEYAVSLTREENPCYLQGRLQQHIDKYLEEKETKDYYICGGNEIVHDMKRLLLSKGVEEEQIHIEIHGVRTKK